MTPYKALGLNKRECLRPECWICGSTITIELHHVIMRAYGGENWPTVNLCADHHSMVHKLAISVERSIKDGNITVSESLIQISGKYSIEKKWLTRIKKLVTILITAKDLISADQNKTLVFSDRFTSDTANKLRSLVVLLNSSQQKVVRTAIDQMYKRYFT